MKNRLILAGLILGLCSCIQKAEENDLGGYVDDEEYFNEFYSDSVIPTGTDINPDIEIDSTLRDTSFLDFANQLIDFLSEDNFIDFATQFHPKKGCIFVPYTLIEDNEQNFTKQSFNKALVDNDTLFWGLEDGSGENIQLTVKDYFERYVYDVDFKTKATDIHINENLAFSNTQNNILDFFPSAKFIEFYYEGSKEYEGMDWSSVIFYIEKVDDKYYLVAVVHNQWTI